MYGKSVEELFKSTVGSQDRRVAAEREKEERAVLRQACIDRQCSAQLSALERVEHWERFHGVRLPLDPRHPLLSVIAAKTALMLEDIRAEQARRKLAKVSA